MKASSITTHLGDVRCQTIFAPSKEEFLTDIETSAGGKGEYPCPADMLAATVASCMLSMMAWTGNKHHFDTRGISIAARAEENGGKLTALHFCITLPNNLDGGTRLHLEAAVKHCPVGNALSPAVEKHIEWVESATCGQTA